MLNESGKKSSTFGKSQTGACGCSVLTWNFFLCVMLENWILNDDVGLGLLKESGGNLS